MNHNRITALAAAFALALSLTSCAAPQEESNYVAPAGVAVQVESVARTTIATANAAAAR